MGRHAVCLDGEGGLLVCRLVCREKENGKSRELYRVAFPVGVEKKRGDGDGEQLPPSIRFWAAGALLPAGQKRGERQCSVLPVGPAAIVVVDHLFAHAAVDGDVLPVDEAVALVAKEFHHLRNVLGPAHPPGRVLCRVALVVDGPVIFCMIGAGVNPSRRHGIDAGNTGQTDGQGMGQCGDAAFGRGIAFGVGLRLEGTGRGQVDDGADALEMVLEEAGQPVGGCHSYLLQIKKILVAGAAQDAAVHEARIIDEAMDAFGMLSENGFGKCLHRLFVGNVAGISVYPESLLLQGGRQFLCGVAVFVYEVDDVVLPGEPFDHAAADACRSAGDDNDSVHVFLGLLD